MDSTGWVNNTGSPTSAGHPFSGHLNPDAAEFVPKTSEPTPTCDQPLSNPFAGLILQDPRVIQVSIPVPEHSNLVHKSSFSENTPQPSNIPTTPIMNPEPQNCSQFEESVRLQNDKEHETTRVISPSPNESFQPKQAEALLAGESLNAPSSWNDENSYQQSSQRPYDHNSQKWNQNRGNPRHNSSSGYAPRRSSSDWNNKKDFRGTSGQTGQSVNLPSDGNALNKDDHENSSSSWNDEVTREQSDRTSDRHFQDRGKYKGFNSKFDSNRRGDREHHRGTSSGWGNNKDIPSSQKNYGGDSPQEPGQIHSTGLWDEEVNEHQSSERPHERNSQDRGEFRGRGNQRFDNSRRGGRSFRGSSTRGVNSSSRNSNGNDERYQNQRERQYSNREDRGRNQQRYPSNRDNVSQEIEGNWRDKGNRSNDMRYRSNNQSENYHSRNERPKETSNRRGNRRDWYNTEEWVPKERHSEEGDQRRPDRDNSQEDDNIIASHDESSKVSTDNYHITDEDSNESKDVPPQQIDIVEEQCQSEENTAKIGSWGDMAKENKEEAKPKKACEGYPKLEEDKKNTANKKNNNVDDKYKLNNRSPKFDKDTSQSKPTQRYSDSLSGKRSKPSGKVDDIEIDDGLSLMEKLQALEVEKRLLKSSDDKKPVIVDKDNFKGDIKGKPKNIQRDSQISSEDPTPLNVPGNKPLDRDDKRHQKEESWTGSSKLNEDDRNAWKKDKEDVRENNEYKDRARRSFDNKKRDPRMEREKLNKSDSSFVSEGQASGGGRGRRSEGNYKSTSYFGSGTDKEEKEFDDWERLWEKIEKFTVVREIQADLFEQPKDHSLAHCVAEDLRMGSGIAVSFKREFKNLPDLLDQRAKQGGLATFHDEKNGRYVYYLVTKRESSGKPTYFTLWKSLSKMRDHVKENNVTTISIPRLAAGLDRLEWEKVKTMIEYLFREVQVEIIVCNFQQPEQLDEKKERSSKCKLVVEELLPITKIASGTLILYLTTVKGHQDETIQRLNKKHKFWPSFEKHTPKNLGEAVYYDDKILNFGLFGCIVRETVKDPISFKSLHKCIQAINKKNRQFGHDAFSYVGIQWLDEYAYADNLVNQKVITMLINYLREVDVYVCKGRFEVKDE